MSLSCMQYFTFETKMKLLSIVLFLIVNNSFVAAKELINEFDTNDDQITNHKSSQPNIVFILADDLGYNDIGYHAVHGMSAVRTPHLDALANEGVKLENYYVQPICSPSRSVLMTGRYLVRYGLQHDVFRAGQPTCLPLSETILPQTLQDLGYATHAVGKWHLGMCRTECLPTRRGFDSFYGFLIGGSSYYSTYKSIQFEDHSKQWKGVDLWDNETPVKTLNRRYITKVFGNKAIDIIRKHDEEKPLYLYLAFKNAHRPLSAPKEAIAKFQNIPDKNRRKMAAMVSVLDDQVKRITHALKERGLWENTVLVFSSDNGGNVKSSGNNWPLRGGKWTMYEGGVRAVAFVTSPLLSPNVRGTVNNELMHISDWFPTFVDGLAGGNTSRMSKPLDGVNAWNTISKGLPSEREEILLNIDRLSRSRTVPRSDREYWVSILENRNDTMTPVFRAGIRRGDLKLLTGPQMMGYTGYNKWMPPPESGYAEHDLHGSSPECGPPISKSIIKLYNITADPKETCNVAQRPENLDIVIDLLQRLHRYDMESRPVYSPPYPDVAANPLRHGRVWKPWLDQDTRAYEMLSRE